MKKKQQEVENGLRYSVLFSNQLNPSMNILKRMAYYKVPGVSIAIIKNNKIEWAKAYGIADEESQQSVNINTLFQAGSISKSITTLGILYLVQQGLVSLDENVNKYLNSWQLPENEFTTQEKVTLRRILAHCAGLTVSGFPGYKVGSQIPSIIEILDGIKPPANTEAVRVNMVPGKKWRYSGGGTTIAQLVLEEVTGESFASWMKNNILTKLDMLHSTFVQPPIQQMLAAAHDGEGNCIEGKHHIYPEMAAAGLWSSPSDIAKFVAFIQQTISQNKTNQFLQLNLIKEMLTSQINAEGKYDNGLGVFLQTIDDEIEFEHDGQDKGFIARYRGFVHQKNGFVIMMNVDATGWYLMEEISNSIADAYQLKIGQPIYKAIAFDDKKLHAKFSGTYKCEERKIIIETNRENLLLQEFPGMPKIKLYPENNCVYFTQEGGHQIHFATDSESLTLTDQNGNQLVFKKI